MSVELQLRILSQQYLFQCAALAESMALARQRQQESEAARAQCLALRDRIMTLEQQHARALAIAHDEIEALNVKARRLREALERMKRCAT